MESENQKVVAIIGRPNVGKSTLFNRLAGKRIAIETPIPGTTRDRLFAEVDWLGHQFTLIDVAGLETGSKKEVDRAMQEGVELAIEEADLLLFVVDWKEKENSIDKTVARKLRASGKKTIMVVNKADNIGRFETLEEFKRLGFQNPIPVSGISGKGTGDLLDIIISELNSVKKEIKKEIINADLKLAVIGRPNVGKSTLLNKIIGQKRAIVSEEAGTTRDSVDINFMHKGKNILISDTAGLRRRGKIGHDTIESFSALRTERALKNSDVAILLIDAEEGLVALDANILGLAKEWGKGIVLTVNKIDLIAEDQEEYMAKTIWRLQKKLNFAPWLPIVFVSALNETNINSLLSQAVTVSETRQTTIPEEELQHILDQAQSSNQQLIDVKSLTQKRTGPPQFEIVVPAKKAPHLTQIRYLENRIRDLYPMNGTPIFIDMKLTGRKGKGR